MAAPARGRSPPAQPIMARGRERRQARASAAGASIATLYIYKELAQQALKPLITSLLKHL
eukprot:2788416-Heterocapsa_arctica.AAC.1